MKPQKSFFTDKVLNRALKILSFVILLLVLFYILTLFSNFFAIVFGAIRTALVPVALAWLLSLILYPVVRFFEKQGIRPRALTVLVIYLIIFGFIALIALFLMPPVVAQIEYFFAVDYPNIMTYFSNTIRDEFIFGVEVYDLFMGAVGSSTVIERSIENLFANLALLLPTTLVGVIIVFAILPILLLFYLLDYERFNEILQNLIPTNQKGKLVNVFKRLNTTVGAYVRGQLVLMISIGTVATVVYRVIGLEYYYLFGILVGFLTVIPYFGIIISMIPILAYAYITKDVGPNPLFIIGIHFVLQFIEGNIFQPIIMGRQIRIHPIVIIVSILFFGSLFGLIGIIFAAPLAATARVLLEFFIEQRDDAKARMQLFKEDVEAS